MLKNIKTIVVIVLIGVLIYALVIIASMCKRIGDAVITLPIIVERQIKLQGDETRQAAVVLINQQSVELRTLIRSELENTRKLVSLELAQTRAAALDVNRTLNTTVDTRLASVQSDLNSHLTKIESDLNDRLTDTNEQLLVVLSPAGELLTQFSDAAPLFLDCEYNPDCLFNRWVGMGRGIEKMAENGAATSKNISRITEDLSVLTREITKPKPWYKHLVDYSKVGVYAVSKFVW